MRYYRLNRTRTFSAGMTVWTLAHRHFQQDLSAGKNGLSGSDYDREEKKKKKKKKAELVFEGQPIAIHSLHAFCGYHQSFCCSFRFPAY